MTWRSKLRKVEQQARRRGWVVDGCPACRDRRGRTVLVHVETLTDGTFATGPDYPIPCPACGAMPERIIEVIELVVESPIS